MTVCRPLRLNRPPLFLGFIVGLISAATVLVAAINPNEWKYRQTLDIPQAGLLKIALPSSTLDSAQPGLGDLRLVNARGEEIPYLIERASAPVPVAQAPRNFRVELQKTATQILIETGTSQPLDHLTLVTPATGFVKAARVEISRDGTSWTLVGDGLPLARQSGLNAVSLPLDNTVASRVRVIIDDTRTAVVPFTAAILHLAAPAPVEEVSTDAEIVRRDEFAQKTVLTIDTHARNLPLVSLEIITGAPLFSRQVRVTRRELENGETIDRVLAQGQIFRTPAARERLAVPTDFTLPARELQIEIINGDDAPLPIDKIRVSRRFVGLIFNAVEAGSYQLLTGRTQLAAPVYDLSRLAGELKNLPETAVRLSPPEVNPAYTKKDEFVDAPLLGSAVDVAGWKFRKPVVSASPGTQELELDLEVLAHAERDLRDLRLVRDGHQVPYLLERSALRRRLAIRPEIMSETSQPRQTRWKIVLPMAGLPLQRLTLSSSTRLFERRFNVVENVRDRRGEETQQTLTSAVWSRRPESGESTFSIELSAAPVSGMLYLETDNGDNPPIAIDEVRADFPVVRLLFRSDQQPLHLYYGSPDAAAPRYDLELVAAQLLHDEKNQPKLGAEERVDGGADGAGKFLGQRAGILLWASLAVVVVVLLLVIARHLPKQPAGKAE